MSSRGDSYTEHRQLNSNRQPKIKNVTRKQRGKSTNHHINHSLQSTSQKERGIKQTRGKLAKQRGETNIQNTRQMKRTQKDKTIDTQNKGQGSFPLLQVAPSRAAIWPPTIWPHWPVEPQRRPRSPPPRWQAWRMCLDRYADFG